MSEGLLDTKKSCDDWVLVDTIALNHFRVKRYPELGLRLKLGNIYSKQELVARCKGDFTKIERLIEFLRDPACDLFEPVIGTSHLTSLGDTKMIESAIGDELKRNSIVREASGEFVARATELLLEFGCSVVPKAADMLRGFLAYPIDELLASEQGELLFEDLAVCSTARYLVVAKESGAFDALSEEPFSTLQTVAAEIGKSRGNVTRKELWIPIRVCLTADLKGPRVCMWRLFHAMSDIDENVLCEYVPLGRRIELLKERLGIEPALESNQAENQSASAPDEV